MTINANIPKLPPEVLRAVTGTEAYDYIVALHSAVEQLTDKVNELDSAVEQLTDKVNELDERVTALEP